MQQNFLEEEYLFRERISSRKSKLFFKGTARTPIKCNFSHCSKFVSRFVLRTDARWKKKETDARWKKKKTDAR